MTVALLPFLSWIGEETREYLHAVHENLHLEEEVSAIQGTRVMTLMGSKAIRFTLNCDNAAHHRWSNTSPPILAPDHQRVSPALGVL